MDLKTLLAVTSRGEMKRWGAWLDGEGRPFQDVLRRYAETTGIPLPEGDLPGKRLLRLCLNRAEAARNAQRSQRTWWRTA